MYLKDRIGEFYWRMGNFFSGYIVVLVNERMGFSGEFFLIGIR